MEVNKLYFGDNLELLKQLDENSIDSCVSDFPYNLGFMGEDWDTISNYYEWCFERAKELLRVLKPGSFCLIFGGTRTHHRLVCAFEDAGFIIKDEMQWLHADNMPKSLDLSKAFDKKAGAKRKIVGKYQLPNGQKWNLSQDQNPDIQHVKPKFTSSGVRNLDVTEPSTSLAKEWAGWGTGLKPAQEPIMVAQKPIENNYCYNVEKWGVGGLNIDASRIQYEEGGSLATNPSLRSHINGGNGGNVLSHEDERRVVIPNQTGRYPSNIILDDCASRILDEQSGIRPSGKGNGRASVGEVSNGSTPMRRGKLISRNDTGGASRFFFHATARKDDKCEGGLLDNKHPTVKPTDLIKYLVRLVTPKNGICLDVCEGSGTHAKACILLTNEEYSVNYIGFENNKRIYKTAMKRLKIVEKY